MGDVRGQPRRRVPARPAGHALERLPRSPYRLPLLGSGLCGALTTFSALQLELLQMLDADRIGLAATYAGATLAAGLLAVVLATSLGRRA